MGESTQGLGPSVPVVLSRPQMVYRTIEALEGPHLSPQVQSCEQETVPLVTPPFVIWVKNMQVSKTRTDSEEQEKGRLGKDGRSIRV